MPIHLISRRPILAAALLLAAICAADSPEPEFQAPKSAPPGMALPFRTAIFESTIRFAGNTGGTRVKVWYSPSGRREELTTSEGVSYLIRGDRFSYGWARGSKTGFKTALGGSTRSAGLPDAFDLVREVSFDLLPTNSRFVGEEEIDGRRVRHYDFRWRDNFLKGIREGSVWVLQNRPFPVRFVNRGVGGKFEVVTSNFQFDIEIPKELFDLPRDVRFSEFEGGLSGRGGGGGGGSPGFAEGPRPLTKTPLPDSAYRVDWKSADVPPELRRSEKKSIPVTFRNVSNVSWPSPATTDPDHASGSYAVRLCARWTKAGAEAKQEEYKTRSDLTQPLAPGQTVTLSIAVTAPSQPGRYELQFDLVQERVAFFESKGAARLVRTVEVR